MGLDLPGAEDVPREKSSGPAADAETMVLLQGYLPGGTCSSSYVRFSAACAVGGERWRRGGNYRRASRTVKRVLVNGR